LTHPGLPSAEEIHAWVAPYDWHQGHLAEMWEQVSAEERTRAGRFHFRKDRDRFVSRRGFRRVLLARYLGVEPEDLEFRSGVLGKPQLAPLHGFLRFSASSSGDLILVGVTVDREIGVDIQQVGGDRQMGEFFRHWTLQEALAKAKGTGLAGELDAAFTATLSGSPNPSVSDERTSWSAVHLWPEPGYAAAIVVEGEVGRLNCRHWERGPRLAFSVASP
jgi:4'-phosphopantetheinyl transferase